MTTNNDKDRLRFLLEQRMELMSLSQTTAAKMAGLNPGALSAVLNNNYQSDDTAVWKKLAIWLDYNASDWELAPTRNYLEINGLLDQAKLYSLTHAIVGAAGCGKSAALKNYAATHKGIVMITCGEYMNRLDFLRDALHQLGKDTRNMTVSEMMGMLTRNLLMIDKPLLILDEADKLREDVFIFFITLFNKLEDNCGLILAATDHLIHRINRGIKYNKKGYAEIYSRIGRKPIELGKITKKDVERILEANGVEDRHKVDEIMNSCEGDLRRVKRSVHVYKQQLMAEQDV